MRRATSWSGSCSCFAERYAESLRGVPFLIGQELAQIGRYNTLTVASIADFGVYLDGDELGTILLPGKWVPRGTEIGHKIEVFLYHDSEDRLIATTSYPAGEVGDFVLLKCKATNDVGSFMEWGLARDLFVPFREQKVRLVEGEHYVVRIYLDPLSDRLAASTKLHQFYDKTPAAFTPNQEVNLLILYRMDLGYVAVVDQRYQGILYHNEVFTSLRKGHRCKGHVKAIREDGKLDLSLQPQGVQAIDTAAEQIEKYLVEHGGSMPYTDSTDPVAIYQVFGMSKKQFKKGLGTLLKKRRVSISHVKVTLLPPAS